MTWHMDCFIHNSQFCLFGRPANRAAEGLSIGAIRIRSSEEINNKQV